MKRLFIKICIGQHTRLNNRWIVLFLILWTAWILIWTAKCTGKSIQEEFNVYNQGKLPSIRNVISNPKGLANSSVRFITSNEVYGRETLGQRAYNSVLCVDMADRQPYLSLPLDRQAKTYIFNCDVIGHFKNTSMLNHSIQHKNARENDILWKFPSKFQRKAAEEKKKLTVAIVLAITSKGTYNASTQLTEELVKNMSFFDNLLQSLCRTAERLYSYNFYIGFDYNDEFFAHIPFRKMFQAVFEKFMLTKNCYGIEATLHMVKCNYTGKPAWAQNDAAMEAYMDNNDYFYRLNDDLILLTENWTSIFITILEGMVPKNVGVTGPGFFRGNSRILAFDFVHQTHINIFGFYYPREFPDWYADGWITKVYEPNYSKKLRYRVKVDHLRTLGRRYEKGGVRRKTINSTIERDKKILRRLLDYKSIDLPGPKQVLDRSNIVLLSFMTYTKPDLAKLLRNAQLFSLLLPEVDLIICGPNLQIQHIKLLEKLANLGAAIFLYNTSSMHNSLHCLNTTLQNKSVKLLLHWNIDNIVDEEQSSVIRNVINLPNT